MSAQQLLNDLLKYLPLRVYGRGAVLTLLREMGFVVKNKTPLTVLDIFRDDESGELVCKLTPDGTGEFTAALSNLKLDIAHPLYRKVKDYQIEVSEALGKQDVEDSRQTQIESEDRGGLRVSDLYKKNK
ncbi:MAG TPA: hypothetical protein EYN05_05265 [Nitrospinaceae bacterium]|jgi:hypothetical protein|nr:hypothetical protein [Nitrospinaceae bacterium]HIO22866.1 hypothetical protein [Nitrospinaceae bacterium]|tara:strand:+ start:579 stop:965 length:387 start_codon:yes stop_codon:yes gene_type:complete